MRVGAPRGLGRDQAASVPRVWFMSGAYHPDTTMDTLMDWMRPLLRRRRFAGDFRDVLAESDEHGYSPHDATRFLRLIEALDATMYHAAFQTTRGVDDDESDDDVALRCERRTRRPVRNRSGSPVV